MKAYKITLFFTLVQLLLIGSMSTAKAQSIEISGHFLQGIRYTSQWGAFPGGTAVSATYIYSRKHWNYRAGMDFRTVPWGSQLAVSLGMSKALHPRVEVEAYTQQGFALFRKKPLFTFAAGVEVKYVAVQKEKFVAGISMGNRYTLCPGYRKYSRIYSVNEIPIGLFVRF